LTFIGRRIDFESVPPPNKLLPNNNESLTMNVQEAIADFLQHGQDVRNLSDRTLRAYHSDLSQFHVHVSDASMVDITPEHLEQYLDKLGMGPYRDTSIRRKVAALKVFFRYLEEKGVVSESPARKLKIKRPVENRVPTVLSQREVRALLSAPKDQIGELSAMRDQSAGGRNRYFCAVRDNLILELLFSTGIRIGELVALNVTDVNLSGHQIQITGRGTRGRMVALTNELLLLTIAAYIDLRAERSLETQALFVGRSGTRLTIYSIENIFKKHVRLAEIKRHVTPHSLRHTMAAMLVSAGTDIREVQEMLGHASLLSTQVYTKLPIKSRRGAATLSSARALSDPAAAKLTIKK
jgi:integrase/recombinase XerD